MRRKDVIERLAIHVLSMLVDDFSPMAEARQGPRMASIAPCEYGRASTAAGLRNLRLAGRVTLTFVKPEAPDL
jgi:hypothetical protein